MPDHSPRRAATIRGFEFEDLISDVFRALGYKVEAEARISNLWIDLLIEKGGERRAVELSTVDLIPKLRADAGRLRSIDREAHRLSRPLIVTAAHISEETKRWMLAVRR